MKPDDLTSFRERNERVFMRRRILLSKNTFLRHFTTLDAGTLLVIIITFVLFALSLLVKGITHDILLETGVFLVSVKLIIMSYKGNLMEKSMEIKLKEIYDAVIKNGECNHSGSGKSSDGMIDERDNQV